MLWIILILILYYLFLLAILRTVLNIVGRKEEVRDKMTGGK